MPEVNLLTFQPTITGQDIRLRKLGIAASRVQNVLDQDGKRFIVLLNDLGQGQVKELLGEEGANQAAQIAQVINEFGDALGKIYPAVPTPTQPKPPGSEGAGSDDTATGAGGDASTSGLSDGTQPDASNPAPAGASSSKRGKKGK